MSSVLPARRSRLLIVGVGAALLIPLATAPAGAQAPGGSASPAVGATVVGTVVQAYADARTGDARRKGAAAPSTWIEPASGPAVPVATAAGRTLPLGATVKVQLGKASPASAGAAGTRPTRQVLAATVVSPAPKPAAAVPMTATPTNEVTVVVVHPAGGTTTDPTTAGDVVAALNGPVTAYWQHESRGSIVLHAGLSSLGFTPYVSTADCSDPVALWREVENAPSVGFQSWSYKHLLIYIPKAPDAPATDPLAGCQYGIGEQGAGSGSGGASWVRDSTTSLLAHELGHNFGLRHSDEVVCDGTILSGSNCWQYSQGDNYDVMGSSWDQLGSLSPPQAFSLGVLPFGQIVGVDWADYATKDVTLTAVALQSGTQTVRLRDHDDRQFWLEYRGAVGQDAWLADPARNTAGLDQGVILHVTTPPGYEDSFDQLDMTPSSQSGWDTDYQTAIKPGHSAWFSGVDYYITVRSATPSQAVVRIQAGDAALTRNLHNHDYTPDLLAADSSGALYDYPGDRTGAFLPRTLLGRGWQTRDAIVMAGDFDGSGAAQDVLARDPAGTLWFYPGTGRGGFYAPRSLGGGWQTMNALLAPGDLTGDGNVDVLARRRSDGVLLLYPGTGTGGLRAPTVIGKGWGAMTAFAATGDFDGNGTTDFVVRNSSGALLLYAGNGHGGVGIVRTIATGGWNPYTSITGVGDWDGDALPDLLARKSDGSMWLFPGNGTGGFYTPRKVSAGWSPYRLAA